MPPRRRPLPKRRATPRRREAPRWTPDEWAMWSPILLARARHACERCGDPLTGPIHRHHRVRRRDGGDRPSNLLVLCAACHGWVHNHPTESAASGWIVEVGQDPSAVPARVRGMLWLLDDRGGSRPLP